MTVIRPTQQEFCALAKDATVVPVTREILADSVTPVVAAQTLGRNAGSFLLESVSGGEKWARYSFVGFDPVCRVRGVGDRFEILDEHGTEVKTGVDPWEELRAAVAARKPPAGLDRLPRFWGGAVGYVGYDAVRRFEPTVGDALPADSGEYEFSFALGGPVLIFDNVAQTLRVVLPVKTGEGVDAQRAYTAAVARIERIVDSLHRPAQLSEMEPLGATEAGELPPSSFSRADYVAAIEAAKEYIRRGDIFQVVLSQRFRVPLDGRDPFDVFRAMRVLNPPYMYFLRLDDITIAGASPETLVRLEDGVAQVRPIAGTRHRGATDAEDNALAAELLADPKERAEHVMLVDLGRNDIGRIAKAGTVRITEEMGIERYSHVMHIVSNVVGDLGDGRDALDVLRATFPAGTLSGAPKVRAMQIIEELEPERRGLYGGAVGYIGFDGNMDVAIAIRTAVIRDGEIHLQAGAGIVEASDGNAEYDETVNKARAGLIAIRAAQKV